MCKVLLFLIMVIGVNVSESNFFGGEHWYSNILRVTPGVRQSNPFKPDSGNVEFDDKGIITAIPNNAVITVAMREGHAPGLYEVTYDGVAYDDVKYVADVAQTGSTFTRNDRGNATLTIEMKVGQDPNLFECSLRDDFGTWRPGLIDSLKFAKVIRFMDHMQTNKPHSRGGLRPPQMRTFLGSEDYGVDVEHVIDVCRETGATPWICLHADWSEEHTNDWLTKLKAAGFSAYVEGGNENWNKSLYHGKWCDGDEKWALQQFMTAFRKSKELGHKNVICTQRAGLSSTGKIQLGNTKSLLDSLDLALFDSLCVNGYFGGGTPHLTDDVSQNLQIINTDLDETIIRAGASIALAKERGLNGGCYECGPAMQGPMAVETQRHDGMRPIMKRFTNWLIEDANGPACIYTHTFKPRDLGHTTRERSFGLLEYGGQGDTPKLLGVLDAINNEQDPEDPEDPVTLRLDPLDIQLIADEVERRIDAKTFTTKVE